MTETLGIHVTDAAIAATVGSDDPSRPPITVMLGASGPTAAAAVAAGPDGAVLVGDAALGADGPVVTDPLERAVRGRTGALTAVFTHVIGRAAFVSAEGRSPTRLAVVVPDDYDTVARDQVVAAANSAGITDVSLVPESLAAARGRGGDGTALAAGAALIGAVDAPPPIVTREDLGQAVAPPEVSPTVPPASDGPVSVFDEPVEPELPPVRETPAPVAAQPPRPVPAAPTPAPSSIVAPPPLRPVPQREVPIGLIVGIGVIALLLVLGFVVFGGGDEQVDTAASTTTLAPTTTAAATTTAAPATTTTTEPVSSTSTSSTSSTSTTSSTSSTTTTTTPVRVATPGPVTLVETGLQFDTGVVVRFGDSEDDVIAAATDVLGAPEADSGRSANDFCDSNTVRFVRWGNLELVFTGDIGPIGETETGGGGEGDGDEESEGSPVLEPLAFSQWFADGHRVPTGLVTPEGVGESATIGLLQVTYGAALQLEPVFEDDIVGIFAVTNPQTGAIINGITMGLDPEGVVTTLWAGESCSRIFT